MQGEREKACRRKRKGMQRRILRKMKKKKK